MQIKIFDELLSKEMTRKEFILHIGLLFFIITGISGLLKTLSNPNLTKKNTKITTGFGSGPYGV